MTVRFVTLCARGSRRKYSRVDVLHAGARTSVTSVRVASEGLPAKSRSALTLVASGSAIRRTRTLYAVHALGPTAAVTFTSNVVTPTLRFDSVHVCSSPKI